MSSFDITEVILEIEARDGEETRVTSFRHKRTNEELNFGFVGHYLCDLNWDQNFPAAPGKYAMFADFNDDNEKITQIWDVQKIG